MRPPTPMSVSFVQAVLLRPRMYTRNGTADEAVAFLEGWHSGLAKNRPDAAPVLMWEAFRTWLAGQFSVDPPQAFTAFIQSQQSDSAALRTLYEWFSTFVEAQEAV